MSELFDTNILIDHLNGIAKATRELKRSTNPAISMITWIEVMTGAATPDEEAILRAFLLNFECLPVSSAVASGRRWCGGRCGSRCRMRLFWRLLRWRGASW